MSERIRSLLLAVLVAGCASKPVKVYTLVDPAVAAPASSGGAGFAIAFEPVTVPVASDGRELVVIAPDGTLNIAENDRWSAPLPDEVQASLSQQLRAQLGVTDVSRVVPPQGAKVVRVKFDVQRFEAVKGGSVRVVAQWSLRDVSAEGVALSCASAVSTQQSGGYLQLVEAYRGALAQIAAQMAPRIAAVASGSPAGCPLGL